MQETPHGGLYFAYSAQTPAAAMQNMSSFDVARASEALAPKVESVDGPVAVTPQTLDADVQIDRQVQVQVTDLSGGLVMSESFDGSTTCVALKEMIESIRQWPAAQLTLMQVGQASILDDGQQISELLSAYDALDAVSMAVVRVKEQSDTLKTPVEWNAEAPTNHQGHRVHIVQCSSNWHYFCMAAEVLLPDFKTTALLTEDDFVRIRDGPSRCSVSVCV